MWAPYDWHLGLQAYIPGFGSVSDADAKRLELSGRAKSFLMDSEWYYTAKGNYSILKFWVDSFDLEWSNPTGGSSGARATVIKEKGDKAIRPPLVPPKKKPRR